MAKAKKHIAARKKSSKRGKASAKPARTTVARATAKKSKPKAARAVITETKHAAKKKRLLKTVQTPRQVTAAGEAAAEILVRTNETTVVDVIEEPAPGVVVVTEYEFESDGRIHLA